MGKEVTYPKETEDWAKVVCEDMDFLKKKEAMTDCSMRRYTPLESDLYLRNLNVSIIPFANTQIATRTNYCISWLLIQMCMTTG